MYTPAEITGYRGNPNIEALEHILSEDEALEELAYYPIYDENERNMPSHLRLHMIQLALDFFAPLPVHLDLEQRFSRLIRAGYQARNPMERGFWQEMNKNIESMNVRGKNRRARRRSMAAGFTIIGFPGVGKTTAVEEILLLYPQVIYHSHYQGRDFTQAQIVWLKLECPNDGSTKGLCINFFQAIDDLLGTNYEERFASDRTKNAMMSDMSRVAARHSLGVLVIDDIQFLSEAKSGGYRVMMNFFTQLTCTIGVPVVLISTYKGRNVLTSEFSQIRRGTGQGDLVWDRMEEGEWVEEGDQGQKPGVWQVFLESLWLYQYTRTPCPLTTELSHVLYEETQGITDFAVKVYMLAQIRAITSKDRPDGGCEETITADIIRSVAQDSLKTAQKVLNALRKNDLEGLEHIEDIHPLDIDPYLQKAQQDLRRLDDLRSKLSSIMADARNGSRNTTKNETGDTVESEPRQKTKERSSKSSTKTTRSKRANKSQDSTLPKGDLRGDVSDGAASGTAAYETLRQAGHIQSTTEFLGGPQKA